MSDKASNTTTEAVATHPVQRPDGWYLERSRYGSRVSTSISLRAYEVYKHVYGEQEALITGDCRGGFGINELVAFLYARSFPQSEWRMRVDEAFKGMKNL